VKAGTFPHFLVIGVLNFPPNIQIRISPTLPSYEVVFLGTNNELNANRLSSLLRPVRHPILQLPVLNSILSPRDGGQTFRAVSINPYNGKDYRDEERELQRKKCSHGLKVEWVDFAPTITDRAKSRLRESAMQRKRNAATATGRRIKQTSTALIRQQIKLTVSASF
jgi:hypothetical protein